MQDLTENFETKLNKIDVLLKKLDDENLTLKQTTLTSVFIKGFR